MLNQLYSSYDRYFDERQNGGAAGQEIAKFAAMAKKTEPIITRPTRNISLQTKKANHPNNTMVKMQPNPVVKPFK